MADEKVTIKPGDVGGMPTGILGGQAPNPFAATPGLPGAPMGMPGAPGSPMLPPDDEEFVEDFIGVTVGGKLYAAGTWPMLLVEFTKGLSKTSRNPQYIWKHKILAGPDTGETFTSYTTLSPNARWKVVEYLEAHGIEAQNKEVRFKKSDLMGKVIMGTIEDSEYDPGGGKEKVKRSQMGRVELPTPEALKLADAVSGALPG